MAYYNASELKAKLNGGKTRELVMGKNEQKSIWIPKDAFFFVRKHYEIQKVPGVTTNKKSCWCLNTEYGKDSKQCRICNHINDLWNKWRNTSNKEEKQKLQLLINRFNGEYFYVNAIDFSDPEQKFVAVKFTPAKIREVMNVIERHQIEHIKWLYKKIITPMANGKDKVGYVLTELIDDKEAIELASHYEELASRDYDKGGLIDLESAYYKKQTPEELEAYLTSTFTEDDSDCDSEVDVLETNTGKKSEPTANVIVNKQETTSIDSLSLNDGLSLDDDLSLDDLSLDDKVKLVKLTPEFINKNKNDRKLVGSIIEHFNEKGWIKSTNDYAGDIKLVYAYVKSNNVEIPESLFGDVVPF